MKFILGKTWQSKIDDLRKQLQEKGTFAIIVPALDNVACETIIQLIIFKLYISYK